MSGGRIRIGLKRCESFWLPLRWGAGKGEDSVEFQTRRKWESALDELATLDFDGRASWICAGSGVHWSGLRDRRCLRPSREKLRYR